MSRPRLHDRDLPQNVYLRRGTYFRRSTETGGWTNLGRDRTAALTALQDFADVPALDLTRIPFHGHDLMALARFADATYRVCRNRAVARGTAWGLTPQIVLEMLVETGGRCVVSGIAFSRDQVGKRGLRPWMPSIDRIDAARGYVAGNVRIVCVAANIALSDFGDGVLRRLAEGIAAHPISSTAAGIPLCLVK